MDATRVLVTGENKVPSPVREKSTSTSSSNGGNLSESNPCVGAPEKQNFNESLQASFLQDIQVGYANLTKAMSVVECVQSIQKTVESSDLAITGIKRKVVASKVTRG